MNNRIDDYRAFRTMIDAGSLAIFEGIPADKLDFRPTSEMMSLGEQLQHLSFVENHIRGLILSELGSNPAVSEPAPVETLAAALADMRDSFRRTGDLLGDLAESDLDRMVALGDERREPIRHLLQVMAEHQLHHRGQIIVYFRTMGMAPPRRWAD